MCALRLDFLQSEKRGSQKISDEREKAACKASQNIKALKKAFGAAKSKFGTNRIFKQITALDR